MSELGPTYKVIMNRRWDLEDLYVFPNKFKQVYSLLYFYGEEAPADRASVQYALLNYPWRGGYSVVNFYNLMSSRTPIEAKPIVAQLRYSSPGWMDLALNVPTAIEVALQLAAVVSVPTLIANRVRALLAAIRVIKEDAEKYKVSRTALALEHAEKLNALSNEVAKSMGFDSFQKVIEASRDPLVSSTIILAHHRRMAELANFVKTGKALLPPVAYPMIPMPPAPIQPVPQLPLPPSSPSVRQE
ncbi:hypothetical protein JH314_00325 [Xanthomonas campestris]|uniref:hypothetical protein n=1 Tax=Xanthomonas campestris TaxID=339 RepID=UPI0023687798|nr:hypothetical protein [Xanthomonas campestris]WDJ02007.1 hypothetical protein JH314_00325 [Xanthomonas campestris]